VAFSLTCIEILIPGVSGSNRFAASAGVRAAAAAPAIANSRRVGCFMGRLWRGFQLNRWPVSK
jgi:hypothetical protein